jgi:hypothetical protein
VLASLLTEDSNASLADRLNGRGNHLERMQEKAQQKRCARTMPDAPPPDPFFVPPRSGFPVLALPERRPPFLSHPGLQEDADGYARLPEFGPYT